MLAVPRRGWENEHLAAFLLSQISFVAQPVTFADDIGSDFFCTTFEPRLEAGSERLFPKSSFAIQVKSNSEKITVTNKIEYLLGLELPFFVGVVDRKALCLSIYSGERLPLLFCHYGRPTALSLVLNSAPGPGSYEGNPGGPCTLRMAQVCDISASDSLDTMSQTAHAIGTLCARMHGNISAVMSREYVFRLGEQGRNVSIMAGPGSADTFRQNFCLRLAEVFFNFEWMLDHQPNRFITTEFQIYYRLYADLVAQPYERPGILDEVYARIKKRLQP